MTLSVFEGHLPIAGLFKQICMQHIEHVRRIARLCPGYHFVVL